MCWDDTFVFIFLLFIRRFFFDILEIIKTLGAGKSVNMKHGLNAKHNHF